MKTRKKRSPIWKIPRESFIELVDKSKTIVEILAYFGFKDSNFKTLKERAIFEGVDLSRFQKNFGHGQLKPMIPLEEILVEGSSYNRGNLKKRLLKVGLLGPECYECGLGMSWNGKELVLVLDHINGVNDDNRIENLRLLCPNCNSQTPTFCGRHKKTVKNCSQCGKAIHKTSDLCKQCAGKNNRKVDRPNKEELEKMLWEKPTVYIAAQYGVSDNAVRKWAKSYGLNWFK